MDSSGETLRFGNFDILQNEDGSHAILGRGSYGVTYKARHRFLKKIVALKVIHDRHMENGDAKQRFLTEAQVVASLDHENIARVFDFGEHDGIFFYAMEFCDGGDLENYSRVMGPQSWTTLLPIAKQAAAAIASAHAAGVLHRDVKPTNLMLVGNDAAPKVKLIDFGLVKILDHQANSSTFQMMTRDGGFVGNPMSAAPEQLLEEILDGRVDLFALGITLWYLLLGRSPFEGLAPAKLVHERLSETPYSLGDVAGLDRQGRAIIEKLICKKPAGRFATADDLIQALDDTTYGQTDPEADNSETSDGESDEALASPIEVTPSIPTFDEIEIGRTLSSNNEGIAALASKDGSGGILIVHSRLASIKIELRGQGITVGTYGGEPALWWSGSAGPSWESIFSLKPTPAKADLLSWCWFLAALADHLRSAGFPAVDFKPSNILLLDQPLEFPSGSSWWVVAPRFEALEGQEDIWKSSGDANLAPTSVAEFAALVYRTISGMRLRPAAFIKESAYVKSPNLSEAGNSLISRLLCADPAEFGKQGYADFIQDLCHHEQVNLPEVATMPREFEIGAGNPKFPAPEPNIASRPLFVSAAPDSTLPLDTVPDTRPPSPRLSTTSAKQDATRVFHPIISRNRLPDADPATGQPQGPGFAAQKPIVTASEDLVPSTPQPKPSPEPATGVKNPRVTAGEPPSGNAGLPLTEPHAPEVAPRRATQSRLSFALASLVALAIAGVAIIWQKGKGKEKISPVDGTSNLHVAGSPIAPPEPHLKQIDFNALVEARWLVPEMTLTLVDKSEIALISPVLISGESKPVVQLPRIISTHELQDRAPFTLVLSRNHGDMGAVKIKFQGGLGMESFEPQEDHSETLIVSRVPRTSEMEVELSHKLLPVIEGIDALSKLEPVTLAKSDPIEFEFQIDGQPLKPSSAPSWEGQKIVLKVNNLTSPPALIISSALFKNQISLNPLLITSDPSEVSLNTFPITIDSSTAGVFYDHLELKPTGQPNSPLQKRIQHYTAIIPKSATTATLIRNQTYEARLKGGPMDGLELGEITDKLTSFAIPSIPTGCAISSVSGIPYEKLVPDGKMEITRRSAYLFLIFPSNELWRLVSMHYDPGKKDDSGEFTTQPQFITAETLLRPQGFNPITKRLALRFDSEGTNVRREQYKMSKTLAGGSLEIPLQWEPSRKAGQSGTFSTEINILDFARNNYQVKGDFACYEKPETGVINLQEPLETWAITAQKDHYGKVLTRDEVGLPDRNVLLGRNAFNISPFGTENADPGDNGDIVQPPVLIPNAE